MTDSTQAAGLSAQRLADHFPRAIARALADNHLFTLGDLLEVMGRARVRWWKGLHAIGPKKAAAIAARMAELRLQPPGGSPATTDHPLIAIPGLAPLEQLELPELLDGSRGRYRAPQLTCLLQATNDIEAIDAWLKRYTDNPHTHRAYRREVERFLLWCVFELGVPMSGVSAEHALQYRDFLGNPQPAAKWCAPRSRKRWEPGWRPFEGPLSHSAIRQAIHILNSLYAWLVNKAYLVGNPFADMPLPVTASPKARVRRRALGELELAMVRDQIDTSTRSGRRLAAIFDLLYATGLRLAGIADARWSGMDLVEYEAGARGWSLSVVIKRSKEHSVAVPDEVVRRLVEHAIDRGLPALPDQAWQRWGRAALIGRVADPGQPADEAPANPAEGLSHLHLARIVKAHFERCALIARDRGDERLAAKLLRASTHWMRHTFATHAQQAGVSTVLVRDNLGHASLASTTLYIDDDERLRMKAMNEFWKGKNR